MKKMFLILGLAGFLAACDNNGSSTENKLDSLGDKIENKSEQVWDSTKEKAKDLKNKIEERLDNDSTGRKEDTVKANN